MAKRKVTVRYVCPNCGSLHNTEPEATECCHGEEVYSCGRGRFHFDRDEAEKCVKSKQRLITCLAANY